MPRRQSLPRRGSAPAPAAENDLAWYAGYLLQLAARCREEALDAQLVELGVTSARWRVISTIGRVAGCTMGELAFFSTIDRTTLTRMADQLIRMGLVARSTPPRDRRKVTLALTQRGERLFRRGLVAIENVNRAVFASIPDEKLRQTIDVLQGVVASVVDEPRELEMALTFSRPGERPDAD